MIKITKEIKDIRKKGKTASGIVKEMEKLYKYNIIDDVVLLKRLRELKVNKSFMDMIFSSLVGLVIGAAVVNEETYDILWKFTKDTFNINLVSGLSGLILTSILLLLLAYLLLIIVIFLKKSYLLWVKSADLEDFLVEKEIEIITDILNKRIENYK